LYPEVKNIKKENNMKTLGCIIRDARVARELTMRKLAEEVGVATGFISDIENGKKFPSDTKVLVKIADRLGLKFNELSEVAKMSRLHVLSQKNDKPTQLRMALARTIFNCESLNEEKMKKIIKILKTEELI
jgi:transcriptional regulator with XRE-family HTH domain